MVAAGWARKFRAMYLLTNVVEERVTSRGGSGQVRSRLSVLRRHERWILSLIVRGDRVTSK